MQLGMSEVMGLMALFAGVAANLVAVAHLTGQFRARLQALEQRIGDVAERFDSDLGRLNGKVDNDVQGRRAVAAMQERVARLETRLEIQSERAA